jgi:hypothetical protein
MHGLHQRLSDFGENDVTHPGQSTESHRICFDKMFAGKNILRLLQKTSYAQSFF